MTLGPLVRPHCLRAGARVAMLALSSPLSAAGRARTVAAGTAELERLGYVPVVDRVPHGRSAPYVSGPPAERASALMRAWADPSIAAVIALRGGYGSAQVLPFLDPQLMRESPTVFVGYSDTTAVLAWLTCHAGISAIHGPMIEGGLAEGQDRYHERSLKALLEGHDRVELTPEGASVVRPGTATGPLFGGTLTVLTASLGTPHAFNPPTGCILFLEDVNERPYQLDRMLTQLRCAGVLDRAQAIIFGEMRGCDEADGHVRAQDALVAVIDAAGFSGPVVTGFPSGHTTGPCWSLPLGTRVGLSATDRVSVMIEESVSV